MEKILKYSLFALFFFALFYVLLCYAITPEKDEEGNFYPVSYILFGIKD